jgi:predicted transposase YdaD
VSVNQVADIDQIPRRVGLLVLSILEEETAIGQAQAMMARARPLEAGDAIMELISTVMLYKFTTLSRDEVNKMLNYTLDELKQTRFYQEVSAEAREEGREEGREEERRTLVVTMLTAKIGQLSARQQTQIQSLPADRLKDLSIALLNFTAIADLDCWLKALSTPN